MPLPSIQITDFKSAVLYSILPKLNGATYLYPYSNLYKDVRYPIF